MRARIRAATSILALTLCSVGAAKARAAAGDITVAVLGIEASDGAPDSVASALTDALRQRVSSSKGFRLVPGRDLVEVKLVFGCPDEAPSCMAPVAKTLGASKLLSGGVKKAGGDGYLVTLKLFDAQKQTVDAWVSEQISRAQASGPAIRGPVQKWFARLTDQGTNGAISVSSDVVGASILLDGLPIGMTTADPIVLSSIPTGRHQIVVSKSGLDPVRRDVDVRSGETEKIELTFGRSPPPTNTTATGPSGTDTGPSASPTDENETRSTWRTAGWATLGGGVVALGLAIKFGIDVKNINSDLDTYRRFPCSDGSGGLCDYQGHQAMVLSADELKNANGLKDDGKNFQTYQWVSYGAAAVLLGTSAFFLYKGYMSDGNAKDGAHASASPRFTFLPQLAPGLAGAGALVTF